MRTEVDPRTDALGPDNKIDLRARAAHRHVRAVGRPLQRGHQRPAERRDRRLQLRRHVRPGAEVCGLRRGHHRGQGRQACLPVDQGRQGRDPRRGRHLGPQHARHDRPRARRDRRGRQGRVHRPGRRAALAHRQHHERDAPGGRPHRRRRGDGLEEPQGRRRVRQRRRHGRRPQGLQGRRDEGAPDDPGAPGRRRRPQGLRHRRAGQHPQPDRRPADAQLPGRLLPDRRQDRRRVAGRQAAGPAQGLLLLHHQLRPGHQGRQSRTTRASAKGPEYETAWSFGADCGIDDLDAITKANYLCNEYGMDTDLDGLDHRLRDGAVRARASSRPRTPTASSCTSATPRPWSRWCARPARARGSATSWPWARTASPRATATPSTR